MQPISSPMNVGGVFKRSYVLAFKGFRYTWLPLVLMLLLYCAQMSLQFVSKLWTGSNTVMLGYVIVLLVVNFFVLWLMAWLYATLLCQYQSYLSGESPHLKNAMAHAWYRTPTFILSILIAIPLFFFGTVAFVLPGLYLMILFIIPLPFLLFDGDIAWDALGNSAKHVNKNWWHTFFSFFLVLLPLLIVLSVIFAMAGSIDMHSLAAATTQHAEKRTLHQVLRPILTTLIIVALFSYFIVVPTLSALVMTLYQNLKLRKNAGF